MLKNLSRETYSAGTVIFNEGDLGTCAYLIEEGSVEVSVSDTQKVRLGRGELFGEIALVDKLPRTAAVRAIDDVALIPIPRELVIDLLKKADPVVRHLLLIVLERFRSTRKQPTFDPTQTTEFWRDATRGVATQHLILAHELSDALREKQFEMFYQPIHHLATGHLAGFEALIRWHHPVRGVLPPTDFLEIAEQTGQIREIGLWSLERACTDWLVLRARTDHANPFVSVNVSPSQLTRKGFVEDVARIVGKYQIPSPELKLELTETVIFDNPDLALELLNLLAVSGNTLALDDFGTGYANLEILQRYPIGTLKVDRTFVNKMHGSAENASIVRSSIELAHSLKLDVIAEGIEAEAERRMLLEYGCDYGQGWAFGKPAALRNL